MSLKWSEIDLDGSCFQLGDTKTGKSTRPIGASVVRILRDLAKAKLDETWLFPNSTSTGPAELKKAIATTFDAAGLKDARSQVLRRTFATAADELGLSEATVGAVLGHKSRTVTGRHYIRRPDAVLVAAATRISDRIAAAMAGSEAQIIKMTTRPA